MMGWTRGPAVAKPVLNKSFLPVLCLASCLTAGLSQAEETFGGGLTLGQTSGLVLQHEDLEINYHLIQADYVFANPGDNDVITIARVPQEAGMRVLVDSQPVAGNQVVTAWVNGADVTAALKHAGLSDTEIATIAPIGGHPAKTMKSLQEAGLVSTNGAPAWTSQAFLQWRQTIPAHGKTRIYHSITAHGTSFGYAPDPATENRLRGEFCADDGSLTKLSKLYARSDFRDPSGHLRGLILDYDPTPGTGEAESMTITIRKSSPYEMTGLCADTPLDRKDPLTQQIQLVHARALKPLHLYFGNVGRDRMPDAPKPSFSGSLEEQYPPD